MLPLMANPYGLDGIVVFITIYINELVEPVVTLSEITILDGCVLYTELNTNWIAPLP